MEDRLIILPEGIYSTVEIKEFCGEEYSYHAVFQKLKKLGVVSIRDKTCKKNEKKWVWRGLKFYLKK